MERGDWSEAEGAVLAPLGMTEQLVVPLTGRLRLVYAVIVQAGHSLNAGHYFSIVALPWGAVVATWTARTTAGGGWMIFRPSW